MGERLLVVDDHPIFRHGLRAVLEQEDWVDAILEAGTVAEAVRTAREHPVTVVAMDIGLPDGDGIEATRRILQIRPYANVLILTMHNDEKTVVDAINAGAHGFAVKDDEPDHLVRALSLVADGSVVLGRAVRRGVLDGVKRAPVTLPPPFDRLTDRERIMLACLAGGGSNARIARQIGLTEKTVRNQVSAMFTKLGVPDRVQAALLVREAGVLSQLSPMAGGVR